MKHKHTPGPWKFKYHMNIDGVGIMEAEFDVTVDDLKIIGAAPEMLELLDDVAMELGIIGPILHPANGHVEALLERIDALLRRIEGEEE